VHDIAHFSRAHGTFHVVRFEVLGIFKCAHQYLSISDCCTPSHTLCALSSHHRFQCSSRSRHLAVHLIEHFALMDSACPRFVLHEFIQLWLHRVFQRISFSHKTDLAKKFLAARENVMTLVFSRGNMITLVFSRDNFITLVLWRDNFMALVFLRKNVTTW